MSKEIKAACKLLADLQEKLYQAAETGNTSEGVNWVMIAAHELMHLSYIIGRDNDDLRGARNVAKLQKDKDIAMIFYDEEDGYDYEVYDEFFDDIKDGDACADDNIDNNEISLSKVNHEDILGFPRIRADIKSVCKECNGKGILDFGFYTRKCMKCCNE